MERKARASVPVEITEVRQVQAVVDASQTLQTEKDVEVAAQGPTLRS